MLLLPLRPSQCKLALLLLLLLMMARPSPRPAPRSRLLPSPLQQPAVGLQSTPQRRFPQQGPGQGLEQGASR
jgi:hypothetical protein